MVYLMRYRTLAELVATSKVESDRGLQHQTESLAEWTLESWRLLEADPLPVPTR
jgi:hypothetical protein